MLGVTAATHPEDRHIIHPMRWGNPSLWGAKGLESGPPLLFPLGILTSCPPGNVPLYGLKPMCLNGIFLSGVTSRWQLSSKASTGAVTERIKIGLAWGQARDNPTS